MSSRFKPVIDRDLLILWEEHKGGKSSRYWFIRDSSTSIPTHVSSILKSKEWVKKEMLEIRYEIPLETFGQSNRVELYLFWASNRGWLPGEIWVLNPSTRELKLEKEKIHPSELTVSSGSPEIDEVVKQIMEAKNYWSSVFCNLPGPYKTVSINGKIIFTVNEIGRKIRESVSKEQRAYIEASLKAMFAYNYFVRNSKQQMWMKMAKEYQNFVLALIHEYLSGKYRFLQDDPMALAMICTYLNVKRYFSRSGAILKYDLGNGTIEVELEPRPSWADLKISLTGQKTATLLVECKQGPPELWIEKSIKQSKRYKATNATLLLVAMHPLNEAQKAILANHYDHIVDNCTPRHSQECKKKLTRTIDAWITK
jgi:hypothetical protein